MIPRVPIAVFASGRGSNFDAIWEAIRSGRLSAEVVAVLSDQPSARVLEKARAAGLRTMVVPVTGLSPAEKTLPADERRRILDERRREHEEKILSELRPLAPRFLIMAGYMRVLTPRLIEAFRSERGYARIVNVHPSLLPAFPGVSAYEQAFRYGAKVSGVTVHLVEHEVDSGPICAQEAFSIADCGSVAEVEKRGLAIEHRLFPETLAWVLPERFEFEPIIADALPNPLPAGIRRGDRYHVRPN